MADEVAELATRVGIMKPNSAARDNVKAQQKLDALLDDPEYVLEQKMDGAHYKMIGNRFFSVENVEKTDNFPHFRDFFERLGMKNLILDGEIYYPGKTSQYAVHVTGSLPSGAIDFQRRNGKIHYAVFDILRTPKANWLIRNTYAERRKILEFFFENYVKGSEVEEYLTLVPAVHENKREYLQSLIDSGLEGGVIKKLDSQYMMGKKPMWQWMKFKQETDVDLVIMGFEPATKYYGGKDVENWPYWEDEGGEQVPVTKFHHMGWIGSIVFGAYVNGVMTKICTASGFPESVRKDMSENPDNYIGRVARVEYMEKTTDGFPRHPTFKNMHEGKRVEECTWEF